MRQLKSCGVICFRRQPDLEFLLMEHPHRFDWPKGHILPDETEKECALREFEEETCIPRVCIQIDPHFRHEATYHPHYRHFGGEVIEKTLVLFLGCLLKDVAVSSTEHRSHRWVKWSPPHRVQKKAIDPALEAVALYWKDIGPQQA